MTNVFARSPIQVPLAEMGEDFKRSTGFGGKGEDKGLR